MDGRRLPNSSDARSFFESGRGSQRLEARDCNVGVAFTMRSKRYGLALALVFALASCSDDEFSATEDGDTVDAGADSALDANDLEDANDDGGTDAGSDAESDANDDAGAGGDAEADAPEDACEPVVWYEDKDGDGWGNEAVTKEQCESPGEGWVEQKGDCHDENADVHPGQTEFFAEPYERPDGDGGVVPSFDYDCDGTEEGEPDKPVTTQAECPADAADSATCRAAAGYQPRSEGATANAYCGSTHYLDCFFVTGRGCAGAVNDSEEPYRCR